MSSATKNSMGWRGFLYVYFRICKKQVKHSCLWSLSLVAIVLLFSSISCKTYYEMLIALSDIGLRITPPLLGFTLSGYALVVGVSDPLVSWKLKTAYTNYGITMYQLLYTTFIAMLGSIFLSLLWSIIIHFAIQVDLRFASSSLFFINAGIIINFVIFFLYTFVLSYAIFAIKDLLSNLFSLGQTVNRLYIKKSETEKQMNDSGEKIVEKP